MSTGVGTASRPRPRRRLAAGSIVAAAIGCAFAGALAPQAFAGPTATTPVTRVTVTAKEFKIALSKKSVPAGTVIFTVVNKGKVAHDFKIAGKKTKTLKPGQRTTLKVVFKKTGRFGYLCTLPGHARAGMKGSLAVAAATSSSTKPLEVGVTGLDFSFKLTTKKIPLNRPVVFTLTNKGESPHDFDIDGARGTPVIAPGAKARFTYTFKKPGSYRYVCTVPRHAQFGMTGTLTVK